MNPTSRDRLCASLAEKALLTDSDFVLSSGSKSAQYVDAKMVTLDPEDMPSVAQVFLEILRKYDIEAVGGPVQGAIPISTAIALYSEAAPAGRLPTFFVRPQRKEHGTAKAVEGPIKGLRRVAIVDDVITSGRSVVDAIEKVKNEGLEVIVVVALVDREAGGRVYIEQHCQNYEHIFTLTELQNARLSRHVAPKV